MVCIERFPLGPDEPHPAGFAGAADRLQRCKTRAAGRVVLLVFGKFPAPPVILPFR
jgi:hypothetical protein